MYLLARLARARGIKVVLTGEGADETFLGYDLFKECRSDSSACAVPIPPSAPNCSIASTGFSSAAMYGRVSFGDDSSPMPVVSRIPSSRHQPRIRLTERIKDYYADDWREVAASRNVVDELRASLPGDFMFRSPLARAAWLEEETLLPGYLLSSQGDRVSMAHGVEGRHPFSIIAWPHSPDGCRPRRVCPDSRKSRS